MIFDTDKEKDVKQVGDIKNNNVSIDTGNIDFIVTILSTNLYSKPIESFIRETVSNAWDSHIEAGVDEPVILELGSDTEGNKFCRIQDFGVGLSPERFNKVYKNIGSSTKRSDNTQIGGFGIGRFSALAYSDVVHITSTHEGKQYIYMMYKDGNSISIDLLNESDTTERNGLEVKLEIKNGDFNNFAQAIKSQLVYFENLYIIDSTSNIDGLINGLTDIQRDYNNFSIKKYRNFWVNTLDGTKEINLVLGKVRYPLRMSSLDNHYPNKINDYPISLKFDIGDLDVTPNREEILYSTKNKEVIQAKLDLAIQEIDDLIANEKTKDFSKISTYLEAIADKQYLDLLKTDTASVRLKMSSSNRDLTLNGVKYDAKNFAAMHNTIMTFSNITAEYRLTGNQIQYKGTSMNLDRIKRDFEDVYISDLGNVKNISKRYIRETFNNNSYFIKGSKPIKTHIRDYIEQINRVVDNTSIYAGDTVKNLTFFDKDAFRVIMDSIVSNLSKIKRFNDNTVPRKWIADTKAADKAKRGRTQSAGFDWKQNINLHEVQTATYGGIKTESSAYKMEDLSKKFKSLTVYAEKDNKTIRRLYSYMKKKVMPKLVELAPTKVKLLKNVNNFIHVKEFMSADQKLIRNIATVELLKREMPLLEQLARVDNISLISEKLSSVLLELLEFIDTYGCNSRLDNEDKQLVQEIYEICEEHDRFNDNIRGLFNANKKELLNAVFLLDFAEGQYSGKGIPEKTINLLVDYVLTRKLIRPSVKAVLKLKSETIFNLKSEEDENNEN